MRRTDGIDGVFNSRSLDFKAIMEFSLKANKNKYFELKIVEAYMHFVTLESFRVTQYACFFPSFCCL